MQFNSSWTPDLPPPALFSERAYLAGVFIHCFAYGAVATLSLQCLALLRSTAVGSPRSRRLWSAVVAFLLICATIYAAIGVSFVSLAFINNRDYPGGPGRIPCPFIRSSIADLDTASGVHSPLLFGPLQRRRGSFLYLW
jgi:hypothetical protein